MHHGRRGRAGLAALALALGACSVAPDGEELADNARFVQHERAHAIELACTDVTTAIGERLAQRLAAESGLPTRVVDADAGRSRRARNLLVAELEHPAAQRAIAALGAIEPSLASALGEPDPLGGAVIATLPDPRDAQRAWTVCLAWSGSELRNPWRDLDLERLLEPTWRTGWQRFEGALCVAASDGSPDFAGPPPEARTAAQWAEAEPELAWLVEADAAARAAVAEVLGGSGTGFRDVRIRLWPSSWALGRVAGGTTRSVVRPASGILELSRDADRASARGALAECHARSSFGEPRQRLLADALAVHAAGAWWGQDLGRWCARLAAPALVLPPGDLERDADRRPHRALPLAALALEVRLGLRGSGDLRAAWFAGAYIDAELAEAFQARLTELSALHGAELAHAAEERRAEVRARPYRRGVNLVLEHPAAGRDESRHGSPAVRAELERARALGADAVALDWANVMRPAARELAWGRHSPRSPWARDVELADSARAARELGLDVLFKPHLWLAEGAGFAGWSLVHNEHEYRRYFDALRELSVHAALLAELVDADVLCLAAEQPNPSATRPAFRDPNFDDAHYDWRRGRWRDLISAARAGFDGGLTYAAGWGGEGEGLAFWGDLDFVGLDLFAPIDVPPEVSEFHVGFVRGRLWEAVDGAVGLARRMERPLLITEFGYPRRSELWTQPGLPSGEVDLARQAQVMECLADVLGPVLSTDPPLAGVYLWNLSVGGDGPYALDDATLEPALRRLFALP